MNHSPTNQHGDVELTALIEEVLNGQADDTQFAELERRLQNDAAARDVYATYMNLHCELGSRFAVEGDIVGLEAELEREFREGELADFRRTLSAESMHRQPRRSMLGRVVAVTAVAALVLVGVFVWSGRWSRNTASSDTPETVAVLHSADGVRWEAKPLAAGEELHAGREIKIAAGIAEIRFASGAVVVLQGPATLQLHSARQASLQDGALSAVVPPQAVGFTVHAPGLKVVDLGTRFGLKTKVGRGAELHVFQGRVQASLVDVGGKSMQTVTVNESEAVIVEPAATAFSTTMAELDAFTFDASLQRDVGGLIAPAINGGSSWEGWTLQGVSNQLGIYGSGSSADVYKVYTTVFSFDDHTVSGSPVGSDGFAPGKSSAGAFANGNTILGIGVERVSGSPIAVPTVKFDLGNDTYKAASSVGGADGQTESAHADAGDFNTQFHYGSRWTPETLAVFDGQGNVDQLTGNLVGYDYAFRSFAVFDPESNQTRAYQLFFSLDAMKALYGPGNPGVGIGNFGSELTFVINGLGSNHAVVRNLSIVPSASRQPRGKK